MSKPFLSQTITKVKALFKGSAVTETSTLDPHIIPRSQHNISRKHISNAALQVMQRLHQEGFEGFLVGGGVRDLLLGGHPKDFDIATDATPEEVQQLFNNARIIGRRFKIVHVRFGRELIEVTTFRGTHNAKTSSKGRLHANQKSAKAGNGMLLRDNVFGTVEEDAIRRDLTINALYYTTSDYAVYDYTHGLQDLKDKIIRIIGDPETRYQEDPVRMLRVVRFASKLGFSIEKNTAAPLKKLAPSLSNIPAARMFDEVLKLFLSGYGLQTYQQMQTYGLFQPLFPQTQHCLDNDPEAETLILKALENSDKRVQQGKPITPAFIYAAFLWPPVKHQWQQLQDQGVPSVPALHQASQEVASQQQHSTSVPKRFGMPMREIWDLQLRLDKRNGHRANQLMENRRFRAAYDFLLLREQCGEETNDLGRWWTQYQQRSPDQRETMVKELIDAKPRRRRHPKKAPSRIDNH
jgi:poly(A) polymerase